MFAYVCILLYATGRVKNISVHMTLHGAQCALETMLQVESMGILPKWACSHNEDDEPCLWYIDHPEVKDMGYIERKILNSLV